MPEGDSVFRTAAQLHEALAGRTLTVADLRVPAHATADLTGRQVLDVTPRGKHLLTRLEGGLTLHTHLRMDGRWQVYRTGERWTGGPGHQIRAVLGHQQHTAVGYRLPVVQLLRTSDESTVVGHLGPDLIGPDWDLDEALRRLTADPARPIAAALLDQRNLAGIGNIYANELCFLGTVTPWTPVGEVAAPQLLLGWARQLLVLNRLRPGHPTTGPLSTGPLTAGPLTTGPLRTGPLRTERSAPPVRARERNWVYARGGRPCLRCGTIIRTAQRGTPPQQRVTYWCPTCQHGPAPTG
ncbi:endonuclease-8 [Kitasatospora sp. MAA4]|uniref:DNA-formamidopyrimidine glycosylase family protein n=1 Tax=Kitasatospora sp. MAA4 TaxID=3035093 RepID=UPI00247496FF|nr:DNA-formamidopyrimidine glycosylase family protein [Kitasatospora sp. MAA4]MDH6133360.1 endonuclease-8 [Kitasatospora sp. MAA4]